MRFIPRTFHGFLDYTVGLFVAALPRLFGFPPGLSRTIPLVLGLGALVYSILTDYELGLIRVIPFRIHLLIDLFSGLVFLAAPLLFQLPTNVSGPYLAVGLFEISAALLTNPRVRGPLPPSSQV